MGVVGVGFDFAWVGCSGRQPHRCPINELLYGQKRRLAVAACQAAQISVAASRGFS